MTAINLCESHAQPEPLYMLKVEPQDDDSARQEFGSCLLLCLAQTTELTWN